MKPEQFSGLMKASPEKRYKSFLTTVADLEDVWMLASEDGYATLELDGYIHLLIWPRREFAEAFQQEDEIISMDVHVFLEQCKELTEDIRFMVFPTDDNAYVVDPERLISDLCEYLDEVE